MKPLKRRLGNREYTSAGSVSTLELPRNFNYRSLLCRLSGSVIVTGGTGTGGVRTYSAYRAISKVEIVANGRDTVLSVAPQDLAVLNTVDYGTPPVFSNPANDTVATHTFSCAFIIPFEIRRAVRPVDTLLPSSGLSTLDLKITWGAGTDLYDTSVDLTTAAIQTTTSLTVQSFEEIGAIPGAVSVSKMYTITKSVTAANTNFQIQVSVGNLYRGFLISSYSTAALIDTVIDGFELSSGTEVYQKWLTNDEVLNYNKLQYSLETSLVGYHYLDFLDSDGFLTEILDTRNLSNLDLILNVANVTSTIAVVPQEVIVPSKG